MKVFKKVCAVVMAATMVTGGLNGFEPTSVYAGEGLEPCGDNLTVNVGGGEDNYTLSIDVKDETNYSGRTMKEYAYDEGGTDTFPWSDKREEIKIVEIGDGVETISANAFSDMPNLHYVTIPESVYYIGKDAFSASNNIYQITYAGTAYEWEQLVKGGDGLGLDLTFTDVVTEAGQGAGYDLESSTIILNTQKPLPEKTYGKVSCFTDMDFYTTYESEYMKCSTGSVILDATRGVVINERWETTDGPSFNGYISEFENNQMYHYKAFIEIQGPNVKDEEIEKYNVSTPNVDWKYKKVVKIPKEHVIVFEGYYLNGKDPHPSINIGETKIDLSDGKSIILEGTIDVKAVETLFGSLEILAACGDIDSSYSLDYITLTRDLKLDLDKDSKYDVEILAEYDEYDALKKVTIKKCEESALKSVVKVSQSEDTAAFAECIQEDYEYYSTIIFDLSETEKTEDPKKDDKKEEVKKEEVKKDAPSKVVIPAAGDTIKDSKFAYKVVKAGSADGKTAGEVEITGCENKKASSINIAAEVNINGIKYKVTSIADYAFKNNKKLKKITIGKNIVKIGKGAFFGCKNLKTIKIKTTLLTKKSVGANAFKKIHKKATVTVPKKVRKAYKKILKAKGIKGKKQRIK